MSAGATHRYISGHLRKHLPTKRINRIAQMHSLPPPTKALAAIALVALLMLTACSTQYGRSRQRMVPSRAVAQRTASAVAAPVAPATTRQVEIISEPPGARIEINDNYIGDAPIMTTFQCEADGRFIENTRIRALPTQPGHYVQSKLFFGGYLTHARFAANYTPEHSK